jgi:hypothetical protein
MEKLHFIADYLVKNEVMDREQFLEVFGENPTFEKLEAIKEAKRKKSQAENQNKKRENGNTANQNPARGENHNTDDENNSENPEKNFGGNHSDTTDGSGTGDGV